MSVAFQLQGRRTKHGRPAVEKRVVSFSIGWAHWHETLATEHEPDLLVTDGETGVTELAEWYFPDARHQRCEWHVPYSLGWKLGEDGMEIESRREKAKELSQVLARRPGRSGSPTQQEGQEGEGDVSDGQGQAPRLPHGLDAPRQCRALRALRAALGRAHHEDWITGRRYLRMEPLSTRRRSEEATDAVPAAA